MQDAGSAFRLDVETFGETSGHLHTDVEHRLGDLDVLPMQEALGVGGELQRYQCLFVIRTA
ncbi:hypothetical protein D3C78_1614990 [compost metagenome]